jgi:hypothetical protein
MPTDEMNPKPNQPRARDAADVRNKKEAAVIKTLAGKEKRTLAAKPKLAEEVEAKPTSMTWEGNKTKDKAKAFQGHAVATIYQGPVISSSGHWKENTAEGESQAIQGTLHGIDLFASWK